MTEEGGFSPRNPFVKLLGWVERLGYRRSDVIVGTMPNLTEHVTEVTGQVLNCQCVPMGYDPALYDHPQPLPEGYQEKYLPEGKFIVGYGGSIGQTNALETLMDCAREMRDDPRFHFVILGERGPPRDVQGADRRPPEHHLRAPGSQGAGPAGAGEVLRPVPERGALPGVAVRAVAQQGDRRHDRLQADHRLLRMAFRR